MCGIYGMVAREGVADGRFLGPMDQALVHRGPDDSGMLVDGRCALGMRRLSIIDLAGGRQPIPSEDRGIWVVLNGEIYNHQAIRRALAGRHQFATASDTEVIVHLYEDLGTAFVHELRGMFACAVWDRHGQALVIARDRIGIKPLYYADTPQGLVFASELRAVLAHPWVGREIDLVALSHYLTFGTTPQDRSIIRGVAKLPPGHVLRWRAGSVTVERYWNLSLDAKDAKGLAGGRVPASEAEAALQVRELLTDAVTSHLVSDVEVGAFLSGGVDSATVVGLMTQAGVRPRTFSIGFDESDFDELHYARLVARHFGTRHEELVVRPDVWSLVDRVVQALDEPISDVSALPTYLVSQLAAKHVKVVLSGDGGDEVFGGYDRYPIALDEMRRLDALDAVAGRFSPLRRWVRRTAGALPEPVYGKYWLRHMALDPRMRYVDSTTLFLPEMQARLLTDDVRTRLRQLQATGEPGEIHALDPQELRARMLENAPGDELGRLLYLDTMTYLPLDILTKVDRMSMAHSLEVRPPLLDTALVEAVAVMPSAWKIAAGEQKRVLKRAVADLVPAEILGRKKRGFGVPIRHWFRGSLREAVAGILTDQRTRTRGLIEPAAIDALLGWHTSGRRDLSIQLWSLLVLELWLRMTLDVPRSQSQPQDGRPETRWEGPALAGHGTSAQGLLAEGGGC